MRTLFLHTDLRSSLRVACATNGRPVAWLGYDPFGLALHAQTRGDAALCMRLTHRYTGHVYEAETKCYHYGARLYDADLTRFVSVDPRHERPSPYACCANDPVDAVDPTGAAIGLVIKLASGRYVAYTHDGRRLPIIDETDMQRFDDVLHAVARGGSRDRLHEMTAAVDPQFRSYWFELTEEEVREYDIGFFRPRMNLIDYLEERARPPNELPALVRAAMLRGREITPLLLRIARLLEDPTLRGLLSSKELFWAVLRNFLRELDHPSLGGLRRELFDALLDRTPGPVPDELLTGLARVLRATNDSSRPAARAHADQPPATASEQQPMTSAQDDQSFHVASIHPSSHAPSHDAIASSFESPTLSSSEDEMEVS